MANIVLTKDQQDAYDNFASFMVDPCEQVFVLAGYSGTGKTTLVKTMLARLPKLMRMRSLLNPDSKGLLVQLTATTNKAAEAFSAITQTAVGTIHSFVGLIVKKNYQTGETELSTKRNAVIKENYLLFIDEASYIDKKTLAVIFAMTSNCKIVFIGDPAQLTPVKTSSTPVFTSGYRGSHLSEVVRQAAGNPIIEVSTKFRHAVETGEFFSFVPDGKYISHLSRSDFEDEIKKEFLDPKWTYASSKVLAWTNKCVIHYNKAISSELTGQPELQVGDYAINNRYMSSNGNYQIKTDQLVCITKMEPDSEEYGVLGNYVVIDNMATFFQPKSMVETKACIKRAKDENKAWLVAQIDNNWIDLRAAFACTINKAQGSTYGKVFIDLDDVSRCNSANQMARLLYVGISRASHQVFLTGDII